MRPILALFVIMIMACSDKPEKPKHTTREVVEAMRAGVPVECIEEARASHKGQMEREIMRMQEDLRQQGVMTPVEPTKGALGQVQRIVVYKNALPEPYPIPTFDVLAKLDVQIKIEITKEFGITEDIVRGYADRVSERLGLADPSLKGYVLTVAASDNMGVAFTSFDQETRRVGILVDPMSFQENIDHELAHVLAGPVFTDSKDVIHIAKEMVAIAAERIDAPVLRTQWTYDLANKSILGMARTINGDVGVIHANGAPLDGFRYDLIRLTDEKIGEEGQVALAKEIYEAGRDGELSMATVRELYAKAGLSDLALLTETLEPGLYLDFTNMKDGTPVVISKTIDVDGFEGAANVPAQFVWRNQKNEAVASGAPAPIQPIMVLGDGVTIARQASALEVRVSGTPYLFVWDSKWSPGANSSKSMTTPSASMY